MLLWCLVLAWSLSSALEVDDYVKEYGLGSDPYSGPPVSLPNNQGLQSQAPITGYTTFENIFAVYQPQSPIIMRASTVLAPPTKTDGKLCESLPNYVWDAPSLVQSPPKGFFDQCTTTQLQRGARGQNIAFTCDENNSGTMWKLTMKSNACWLSPFHSHATEESWVVTKGSWTWQYYDPGLRLSNNTVLSCQCNCPTIYPPGHQCLTTVCRCLATGEPLTFDDRGFPCCPNKQSVLGPGDVILMKRGSFFQWGSSTPGSQVVVTWTGSVMNGAPRNIEQQMSMLLAGQITPEDFAAYLAFFQQAYITPFVRCMLT